MSIDYIFYFSGVKIKGYAIFLLISFLMVVAHGMIPHHHHDSPFFHVGEKHVHISEAIHSHDNDEAHHHDIPAENSDEHQHSAPFHLHVSVVHGYDFLNIKSFSHNTIVIELPAFVFNQMSLRLIPPPDFEDFKFTAYPLIIPPEPALAAALLRAPPVFA